MNKQMNKKKNECVRGCVCVWDVLFNFIFLSNFA